MRIHDDLDMLGRQPGGPTKQKDTSADVGHALANPKQASVQTMLEVQRLAGNAGVSQLLQRDEDGGGAKSPVLDVVGKGGGQALDGDLREEMEGRLGADFSDVKVHTDSKASDSARAVQANAYTVGNEIVMRQDRWSPSTSTGKETLAHELTHVVQQRAGPVEGTSQGDGVSVSDPNDRFERAAESTAKTVMSQPASAAASGSGTSAQLHADDEVQRQALAQRDAGGEEDETAQMQRQADEEVEEESEGAPAAQMQRQAEEEVEEESEGAPAAQMQRDAEEDETEAETA